MLDQQQVDEAYENAVARDPDLAARMVKYELQKEPMDFQRCDNCIYYLPHSQYCDHPDFKVIVGADWWCNIWKI